MPKHATPRRETTAPLAETPRASRVRLPLKGELLLALLPTATVLAVFALVETFSHQRLLFASLASSAFLIYLDPQHSANKVRTLLLSQAVAAGAGYGMLSLLGPGYSSAALAMLITIVFMVVLDAVHPPAVSTALSFAFKGGNENNLLLFALAVGLVALLVGLQQSSVWLLRRLTRPGTPPSSATP